MAQYEPLLLEGAGDEGLGLEGAASPTEGALGLETEYYLASADLEGVGELESSAVLTLAVASWLGEGVGDLLATPITIAVSSGNLEGVGELEVDPVTVALASVLLEGVGELEADLVQVYDLSVILEGAGELRIGLVQRIDGLFPASVGATPSDVLGPGAGQGPTDVFSPGSPGPTPDGVLTPPD